MKNMKDEKAVKVLQGLHSGPMLWILSRPSSHWIWRYIKAVGVEGLPYLEKIMLEMAGFRGWPSRGQLTFYEIRSELQKNWDQKYFDKSVVLIVGMIQEQFNVKVTQKFLYSVFRQIGVSPKNHTN